MAEYRKCLMAARDARLDGRPYDAAWWLHEAMVARATWLGLVYWATSATYRGVWLSD